MVFEYAAQRKNIFLNYRNRTPRLWGLEKAPRTELKMCLLEASLPFLPPSGPLSTARSDL